ncbi:MAG: hypothetical protein Q9164_007423 [Protoblastenia rupestris]
MTIMQPPPVHTAHPSLQEFLQISQALPRRPLTALRVSRGRRGLAGPPPPDSWLEKRKIVKRPKKKLVRDGNTMQVEMLPGSDMPRTGSLLDQAFRSLARDWDWHVHYDQYYLFTLPVRQKEALLHYIGRYSERGIDSAGLEVLFSDGEELADATGAEGLTHLDLSTSIGHNLTFRSLRSFFTSKPMWRPEDSDQLPDNWEMSSCISTMPYLPKFHFVTHLSLSHPSPSATWKDLLDFAPNFNSLTHLSLAYWPTPTSTPNALTAFTSTPSGNVSYGASNFYSEYDNDWSEAASILRRLSKHMLCLQWLDLTGCYPWIQCLSYPDIPWCGAWAGLSTVKIGQGFLPSCLHRTYGPRDFQDTLGEVDVPKPPHTSVDEQESTDQETDELASWAAQEKQLQKIEKDVRTRIKATMSETKSSKVQRCSANISDDWTQSQHHDPPKAGSRTTRLVFDYGWQDPRSHEAIEFLERHGSSAKKGGRL